MIFIYPASVSETCDKRIVPAVAKCIERFFLTQIADAMADNVIPLSRKYKGNNYGPILMECVNNYNKKQLLTEHKILLEDDAGFQRRDDRIIDLMNRVAHSRNIDDVEDAIDELNTLDQQYARDAATSTSDLTGDEYRELRGHINNYIRQLQTRYHELERQEREDRRNRETLDPRAERDEAREDEKLRLAQEKDRREWQKERRDDELSRRKDSRDMERNARDFEEYADRRAGSGAGHFMPLDSKIDITPTTTTVTAPIMYNGGPLNGRMKEVELNISVKVIPTIIKNFKVLEKDMLDDAFTKKSEMFFKTRGRNIARNVYNVLKRLPFGMGDAIWRAGMMTANGDDVERESRKDIIYNTQGFVNASAFHKSSNSPNNYNYTSNIVIFNKDDLTDPDDANIFQNRTAMVKLFKLGWSTFCMLDPVEEMMYFISSLDGGYMHPIPYRYIMESYGSRAYYGTEEKLKDSAKPFMIKRGNFSNFAKVFYKKRR